MSLICKNQDIGKEQTSNQFSITRIIISTFGLGIFLIIRLTDNRFT